MSQPEATISVEVALAALQEGETVRGMVQNGSTWSPALWPRAEIEAEIRGGGTAEKRRSRNDGYGLIIRDSLGRVLFIETMEGWESEG